MLPSRAALALVAALALAACQQLAGTEKKPIAPQITEESLRARAQEQLAQGSKQYEAGDYEAAVKSLNASLEHGLLSKTDQSKARKLLAFSYCVTNREPLCRDQFRKAFEINPDFALTPAEDGHPIWGPVYRDVRTQLIEEREAAAATGKPSAALGKAEQLLADGLVKYDAGNFGDARKLLEAALAEGLKDKPNQVKAMKFQAFTLCLQKQYRKCREAFIRIYDVDPDFDLAPAEAGHPSWTHTFAAAKATAKRALAAKAAREAKEKGKEQEKRKKSDAPATGVPAQ